MRVALGIEYDGSSFLGWQRQAHGPSVQAALEQALSAVADAPTEAICAGRTDTGVHARCQVVHFDTEAQRTARGWALGATSRLPNSVCVRWAQPVDAAFHARFAARARRYRYRILNRGVRPAMQRDYLTWERLPIDAERMHAAAQSLLGEHDFNAFRSVQCQAAHARRDLQQISVRREDEIVILDVRANAFLHHMVRNIVGSLLLIGRGEQPVEWLAELLAGRDRTQAGPTAPAQGLCFLGPLYPAEWNLPDEVTL
jgi:tRNA pseudouridine38-40 synthase